MFTMQIAYKFVEDERLATPGVESARPLYIASDISHEKREVKYLKYLIHPTKYTINCSHPL